MSKEKFTPNGVTCHDPTLKKFPRKRGGGGGGGGGGNGVYGGQKDKGNCRRKSSGKWTQIGQTGG